MGVMEETIKRAEHPMERCQYTGKNGQCGNAKSENSNYCLAHGDRNKEKPARIYALTKYRARLQELADDPQAKSLTEELGMMRMMLEMIINRCTDDHELLLNAGPISEMISKIERLVVSCDKLDQRRGQLLDKSVLLRFASEVVGIIGKHLADDPRVNLIADDIMRTLGDTSTQNGDAT